MILVEKRDGSREEFVPAEIVLHMIRIGVPAGYAQTIAQTIGRTACSSIATWEIEAQALRMLMAKNPEWVRRCIAAGRMPRRMRDIFPDTRR